ncbi:hypothetical protein Fmac_001990 [Flemingia macrophylla]|uniref:Uncharacterized protein n=1 Tax=Flemingia macrophylla TaxID=520843 RepID=A0ABD1NLF7_9FABA
MSERSTLTPKRHAMKVKINAKKANINAKEVKINAIKSPSVPKSPDSCRRSFILSVPDFRHRLFISNLTFAFLYFRHASGEVYVISKVLAQFISINRFILRTYPHDDASTGSWFIRLDVQHLDETKFCCSSWSPEFAAFEPKLADLCGAHSGALSGARPLLSCGALIGFIPNSVIGET